MRNGLIGFTLGAALLGSACTPGEAGGMSAQDTCGQMLSGDPEIEADLAEFDATVDDYCACFATTLESQTEEDRDAIMKVVSTIAELRTERNIGLEAAAELLEEVAEGRNTNESIDISGSAFETAGRFVDGIRNDLRDNDGQCPAS